MNGIGRTLALCAALWGAPSVGQELGALARFDPAQSAAADVRGGAELSLALSQGVPWRAYTLDDPARLVLDFREVDWGEADMSGVLDGSRIAGLRSGTFRPGWSRLVADLAEPMRIETAGLKVAEDSGAARLQVRLASTDAETFAALSGAPNEPRWDLPAPSARVEPAESDGTLTVMLDPGHGGIDPGAETDGPNEAELMLLFARELKEVLLRAGGFDVAMTRESDTFVSLEGRVAAAHRAGADVLLSLHADAIEIGVARGATIYVLSEEASDAASAALAERHDRADILAGVDLSGSDDRVADVLMDLARLDNGPRSRALASELLDGIKNAVGRVHKRPLRQAGFSVLKAADIPSVLIELGFLSTEADLKNLQDPAWRAGMAAGIRDGLIAWRESDAALAGLRRQ